MPKLVKLFLQGLNKETLRTWWCQIELWGTGLNDSNRTVNETEKRNREIGLEMCNLVYLGLESITHSFALKI